MALKIGSTTITPEAHSIFVQQNGTSSPVLDIQYKSSPTADPVWIWAKQANVTYDTSNLSIGVVMRNSSHNPEANTGIISSGLTNTKWFYGDSLQFSASHTTDYTTWYGSTACQVVLNGIRIIPRGSPISYYHASLTSGLNGGNTFNFRLYGGYQFVVYNNQGPTISIYVSTDGSNFTAVKTGLQNDSWKSSTYYQRIWVRVGTNSTTFEISTPCLFVYQNGSITKYNNITENMNFTLSSLSGNTNNFTIYNWRYFPVTIYAGSSTYYGYDSDGDPMQCAGPSFGGSSGSTGIYVGPYGSCTITGIQYGDDDIRYVSASFMIAFEGAYSRVTISNRS